VPLLLALAACGGGKSKPAGASVPEPPAASDVEVHLPAVPVGWQTDRSVWAAHSEYQGQAGLATLHADYAYAKAITGQGITIGFIDTGLDATHSEFSDKTIALNDRSGLESANQAQLKHGTAVASVALGARGHGSGMHGVAFDANPAMWSLHLEDGFLTIHDTVLTKATKALEGVGARIINQSWGYNSTLNPDLIDSQRAFLRQSYGNFLTQMRQGKAIHVWAAGNEAAAQVSVSAAWPIIFPELAGYAIAVAALDGDGTIGRQTNHCGAARNHCLAAPGGVAAGASAYTRVARAGGGYRFGYGTSYAAPFVSGVLALMMQAYGDQLSLPEYTARLLGTANKTGIYADASIYGQGLVDVQAALAPYGETHIPLPAGGVAGPSETKITDGDLPREMLDRLRQEKIIIIDALDTPFETSLVSPQSALSQMTAARWLPPQAASAEPAQHPFLARLMAPNGDIVSSASWQVLPWQPSREKGRPAPSAIGFAARRPLAHQAGHLQLAWVAEQESLLASAGEGGLKFGPAFSGLFSLHRKIAFGQNILRLDAHLSLSQLHGARDSLLMGSTRAVATSLSLAWERASLRFLLRQPTYFETGELQLSLPYKRVAGGGVLFRDKPFSMQAPQRPFEMAILRVTDRHQFGLRLEKQAGLPKQISLGVIRRF
jgi:hypothetical protein